MEIEDYGNRFSVTMPGLIIARRARDWPRNILRAKQGEENSLGEYGRKAIPATLTERVDHESFLSKEPKGT